MRHDRFTRGTWNCSACGRLTRNAGQDDTHCPQCCERTELENSILDGVYDNDPAGLAKARARVLRLQAEAIARGGVLA